MCVRVSRRALSSRCLLTRFLTARRDIPFYPIPVTSRASGGGVSRALQPSSPANSIVDFTTSTSRRIRTSRPLAPLLALAGPPLFTFRQTDNRVLDDLKGRVAQFSRRWLGHIATSILGPRRRSHQTGEITSTALFDILDGYPRTNPPNTEQTRIEFVWKRSPPSNCVVVSGSPRSALSRRRIIAVESERDGCWHGEQCDGSRLSQRAHGSPADARHERNHLRRGAQSRVP